MAVGKSGYFCRRSSTKGIQPEFPAVEVPAKVEKVPEVIGDFQV